MFQERRHDKKKKTISIWKKVEVKKAAEIMGRREGVRLSKITEATSLLLGGYLMIHHYLQRPFRTKVGEHQILCRTHIPSVKTDQILFLPLAFSTFFHHLTQDDT